MGQGKERGRSGLRRAYVLTALLKELLMVDQMELICVRVLVKIAAAQTTMKPSNRAVLHHVLTFVFAPQR